MTSPKNSALGQAAIERRFIPMVDRAVLLGGEHPHLLTDVERAILHLESVEDRLAAQRILLRAQDAHRMHLDGAQLGFIWIGCLRLKVSFLDGRTEFAQKPSNSLTPSEASRLWELFDKQVRELSKSSYITSTGNPRPGTPTWPGVVVHATSRCTSEERAWIAFHSVTNMSTELLHKYSMEGGAYPGPLMVCAAIPDESMNVALLQDPSKKISNTTYAQSLRRRLDLALEEIMSEMPHLQLLLEGEWTRMSEVVEQGEAVAAGNIAELNLPMRKGQTITEFVELVRSSFPEGLDLVCGAIRTIKPTPGQAAFLILCGANSGRIIAPGFSTLMPGTDLRSVAREAITSLAKVGLSPNIVVLEPTPPIQILNEDTAVLPCADGLYRKADIAYFGKSAWGFKSLEWNSGWNFDGPGFESDEALRKLGQLPHPIAMQIGGVETALKAHYGESLLTALNDQMSIPGRACDPAIENLIAEDPLLQELLDIQANQDLFFNRYHYFTPDGIYPPVGVYCAAHWKRVAGVLMVVRTSLLNRLEETTIEKGFPLKSLRLPFQDIYFHFEKPLRHQLEDEQSFILTGFYASEEVTIAGNGQRRLTLTYTYLYGGEVLRIGGLDVSLEIEADDSRDLTEVIAMRRDSINSAAALTDSNEVTSLRFTNETLVTAAKVVLYTTLKNARTTRVDDRSRLVEQLRNIKGSKRDKMNERLSKAYDYIAIGPEESDDGEGAAEMRAAHELEAKGIKPHWRRGFFRTQHFGSGRTQSYDAWIPPVLVNGHLVDGSPPVRKDYDLD